MKRSCLVCLAVVFGFVTHIGTTQGGDGPEPRLKAGEPVDWWFVFKFNTKSFPGCPGNNEDERQCPFGGDVQHTKNYEGKFSQQFVFASSKDKSLKQGSECAGATTIDPLGSTFGEVYNNPQFFVVWNDQFKGDPSFK